MSEPDDPEQEILVVEANLEGEQNASRGDGGVPKRPPAPKQKPGYTIPGGVPRDLHKETADTDETFHRMMDTLDAYHSHTVRWRERLNDRQKRQYAKCWNYAALFGTGRKR